jgi:hypothetical protein
MPPSATSNFELTRDGLLRRSMQLAGLLEASQSPSANDLALASDLLGMELDALQAEGVVLRTVEMTTEPLIASTVSYTLSSDCIDVFVGPDNVAGTIVPATGNETLVRAISRQEYVAISNKTSAATPSLVYVEKLASVKLYFWPVPPVSTASFRYSKIRLPRDADTGAVTLDLSRRWQKAMCYSMAWQIAMAKSSPLERVKALRSIAEEEKAKARANDVEKTHQQLYVARYY